MWERKRRRGIVRIRRVIVVVSLLKLKFKLRREGRRGIGGW